MHPLSDRWIQMLVMKKKIKRKAEMLREYKQKGRRHLRAMKKIRAELLINLKTLLNEKLKDTKLAEKSRLRHTLDMVVNMNRNWLRHSRKNLIMQKEKLQKLQLKEKQLDERLFKLRKQFVTLPRRHKLLKRFFKNFSKVQEFETGFETLTKGSEQNLKDWQIMVNDIKKYLISSHLKRTRPTRRGGETLLDLSSFWKLELLPKKATKTGRKKIKFNTKEIILSKLELPKYQVPVKFNFKKTFKRFKEVGEVGEAKEKLKIMKFLEELTESKKKSRKRTRKSKLIATTEETVEKEETKETNDKKETKSPTIEELEDIKKDLNIMERNTAKELKKEIKEFMKKHDRHKSVTNISLKDMLDFKIDLKRKIFPKGLPQFYAKQEVKDENRKTVVKNENESNFESDLSITNHAELSKKERKAFNIERKKLLAIHLKKIEALQAKRLAEKNGTDLSEQNSDFLMRFQNIPHEIAELLKNKIVPGEENSNGEKSVNWQAYKNAYAAVKKKNRAGVHLMNALEENVNEKTHPIQLLLRDVIEGPSIMDVLADKFGIVKIVLRHYMWANLATIHQELLSVGISKAEAYRIVREQYLKYIDDIVADQIKKGAQLVMPEKKVTNTLSDDQLSFFSYESFNEFIGNSKYSLDVKRYTNKQDRDLKIKNNELFNIFSERPSNIMPQMEFQNLDDQYSPQNIKRILAYHIKYFNGLKKTPLQIKLEERKLRAENKIKELKETLKTDGKKARPSRYEQKLEKRRTERLFYEPRKTCRQRQAEECREDCKCEPKPPPKCKRCGVQVPTLRLTPQSSSCDTATSKCSLVACAKNQDLLRCIADICQECGFVHDKTVACPQLLFGTDTKPLQKLRTIRHMADKAIQRPMRPYQSVEGICARSKSSNLLNRSRNAASAVTFWA